MDFDDCPPKVGEDDWRGDDFVVSDTADRADMYRDRTGVRGMQNSSMIPANTGNYKSGKGGKKSGGKKKGC